MNITLTVEEMNKLIKNYHNAIDDLATLVATHETNKQLGLCPSVEDSFDEWNSWVMKRSGIKTELVKEHYTDWRNLIQ